MNKIERDWNAKIIIEINSQQFCPIFDKNHSIGLNLLKPPQRAVKFVFKPKKDYNMTVSKVGE